MTTAQTILNARWDGSLPVDPKRIASALGIGVSADLMDESGCIELVAGRPVITYSAQDASVRQRFTIAHEIGHFVLGHMQGAQKKWRDPAGNFSSNANRREEREANDFAAQLLMPANALRFAIEQRGETNVARLAKMFGVSEVAMGYRLKNLGLINV